MVKISNTSKRLILIMGLFSIAATVVIQWYYKNENSGVDPRITKAREMYENYNEVASQYSYDSVLNFLDAIEAIYGSIEHYAGSFETGVLYNNRAAVWLTMGLYESFTDSTSNDSLIALAKNELNKGIEQYNSWNKRFSGLDTKQIEREIKEIFYKGLENNTPEDKEKYLNNRVKEIEEAQIEIDRRLSVSYTNLGIIFRYNEMYDSAVVYYQKALKLWDRNLTAENNMNVLLGRPERKQNLIEKMFPRERL